MIYPTKVKKQKTPDLNLLAVNFAWNEKRQLTIFLLYSEVCILIYFIEFKFWTHPPPLPAPKACWEVEQAPRDVPLGLRGSGFRIENLNNLFLKTVK